MELCTKEPRLRKHNFDLNNLDTFFGLRYWAVTQVQYIHSRTFRTVGTMILLIWLTSVVVSLAPLFGWKDEGFYDRVNVEKQCLVSECSQNPRKWP